MQPDSNNIDPLIHEKAREFLPDHRLVDQHWKQMQALMTGSKFTIKSRRNFNGKNIHWLTVVAASLVIFSGIWLILNRPGHQNEKALKLENQILISAPLIETNTDSATREKVHRVKKGPGETIYSYIYPDETKNTSPIRLRFIDCNNDTISSDNLPDSFRENYMENETVSNENLLNKFYSELRNPVQSFIINAGKDTLLFCAEGTQLKISANIFSKNGRPVTGKVMIEVREFYSYADIITNKLSTTSDNSNLVSGGMLEIRARQDGMEVELTSIGRILVSMPTPHFDPEMQLFSQESPLDKNDSLQDSITRRIDLDINSESRREGKINWKPAGQFQRIPFNRFYVKIFDPYGQPYSIKEKRNGKTIARFMIKKDCKMSNAEGLKGLTGHFNMFYDKIRLRRSWSNHPHKLFSKTELPLVGDSMLVEFNFAKSGKLISPEEIEKYEKIFISDSMEYAEKIKKTSYYRFELSHLGLMNCDRFQNSIDPQAEFTLDLGPGKKASDFISLLAFKNYKTVLQGYFAANKVQFRNIPANEPVHFICVGIKDGKIISCIQRVELQLNEKNVLKFSETSPSSFRNKILSLGLK